MSRANSRKPFRLVAQLGLERGADSAADAARRYAPLAGELGASGMTVEAERVDLFVPAALVNVSVERAMDATAWRLLRRFGWRDEDFGYNRPMRYAETWAPPAGPPATSLTIHEAEDLSASDGVVHGFALAPARVVEIYPAEGDAVNRVFVTVPATTVGEALDALEPWLKRMEPAGIALDGADGRFRAALLSLARWDPYPMRADLGLSRTDLINEATRLGLGAFEPGRIEAGPGYLIETATAADGTTLWMRQGCDPVYPQWPGIYEPREMVIDEVDMTEDEVLQLVETLREFVEGEGGSR